MSELMTEQAAKSSLLATFEVNGALFAMDAGDVHEVVRLGPLTAVSHSTAEVAGILNLRGRIVTILDTGLLLGLGAIARSDGSRIFIVDSKGEFIGLLVDTAGDVREMERVALEPMPSNISRAQARFAKGVLRIGDGVLTVLDSSQLAVEIGA